MYVVDAFITCEMLKKAFLQDSSSRFPEVPMKVICCIQYIVLSSVSRLGLALPNLFRQVEVYESEPY